jgi:cytochrome c-type biogenesis protein CcmE
VTPRRRRLILVGTLLAGVTTATALAVTAFRQNMLYFFSPSQIAAGEAPVGHPFRLGGLVEKGTLRRESDGLTVHFVVTDTAHRIPVSYSGILPDLFREGQGIVALGKLDGQGSFAANEVLAKHDENYMPPEVADALKTAGAEPAAAASKTSERGL